MKSICLHNQRKHDYLERYKHGTDKVIIHEGKEFALFTVSCDGISGKRVCDQCKNQIHHCDKCCIKKLSWKICHYPGICKVLKSDFPWQCQNVVHICWILDGNHQCHIKRQQDDKYDSNDQKDRNRPVVTLFYFHCILFHPNFSSLFSSTRSWNTEISTTTTKSITALAD